MGRRRAGRLVPKWSYKRQSFCCGHTDGCLEFLLRPPHDHPSFSSLYYSFKAKIQNFSVFHFVSQMSRLLELLC